jgi:glycerol kinase
VRAELIAFRTRDVLEAMASDAGQPVSGIKVDGGAWENGFLMQALAAIAGIEVHVSAVRETTAPGVAFLAGLGCCLWHDQHELTAFWRTSASYTPRPSFGYADLYPRWLEAVERSRGWASDKER